MLNTDFQHLRSRYGSLGRGAYESLCCAEGIGLSKEKASALNDKLEIHPEDLESRLMLLGYYFKFQNNRVKGAERQKHIMWMLRNRPRDFIFGTINVTWAGNIRQYYSETKALWLELIKANPKDAVILGNAGCFFYNCSTLFSSTLSEAFTKIRSNQRQFSESVRDRRRNDCEIQPKLQVTTLYFEFS